MSLPTFQNTDTSVQLSRLGMKTDNIYTFVSFMVDFFTAVYRAKPLTSKEKTFFISLVVLNLMEVKSYKDEKATELFGKNLGWRDGRSNVTRYLGDLFAKKWVTYNTKDKSFVLPTMFLNLIVNNGTTFDCGFSIKYQTE